jgi:hypothetical protein
MKCPSCSQRKGKRPCPALRTTICSHCCGSKQVREIACPADCAYLVAGREYREIRHYRRQLQGPDAELFEKGLLELQYPLRALQLVLVNMHRLFRGYTNLAAMDAVNKVLQTCETESRGVIFEQRSSDPQIQATIQDLMKEIADLRKGPADAEDMPPTKLAEIILCLKFLEKDIAAMQQESADPAAYLEFLASSFPEANRPASSLIIPG